MSLCLAAPFNLLLWAENTAGSLSRYILSGFWMLSTTFKLGTNFFIHYACLWTHNMLQTRYASWAMQWRFAWSFSMIWLESEYITQHTFDHLTLPSWAATLRLWACVYCCPYKSWPANWTASIPSYSLWSHSRAKMVSFRETYS